MRKGLKLFAISLIVTIIMIIASAGAVLAASPNSGDCPNPDCPRDGDGLKYQYRQGPYQNGNGEYQYQYRFCQE